MTLPCPAGGNGRCRCAQATLFAPAGQKRFRVGAPDFGLSRGRAGFLERFAHQEWLAGAPGKRKADSNSCRLRFQNAACFHRRPKRNESQPVCPLLVGQTGVYFEPTALSAGTAGPAGSARTLSRDQSLENPFLGNGSRCFPAAPSPTPQAASPCAWACRRLFPPPLQPERNDAPKPPTRGAWARLLRANGTGRRHCRPLPG